MIVYDLYVVKSGNCYITKVYKDNMYVVEDLAGAKIFNGIEKAHAYIKRFKDIDFKIVRLVEEADIKC